MKIYLDTSALNRIFDDQSQARIYLEASSMLIIFMLTESGAIDLAFSEVLLFENANNPYHDRKIFVDLIIQKAKQIYSIDDKILTRSGEIEKFSIKGIDSLHLACAEALKVDCFVTCDDRIIKNYKGTIKVKNPIDFVANILEGEEAKD